MKLFPAITLSVLASTAAYAQAPAAKLEFEVASIRPSAKTAEVRVDIGIHMDGQQVRIAQYTLRDYAAMAYRLKLYQVTGPDWTNSDRFDITAKLPPGAKSDQIPELLQALLEERFQLKSHRDKKDLPVYALIPGKNPLKLKEIPHTPEDDLPAPVNVAASGSGAGVSVDLGRGSSFSLVNSKLDARKVSMEMLARMLERYTDRPVVDETGIKGNYDASIDLTQEDYQAMLIRAAIGSGMTLPPQVTRLIDGNTLPSLLDGFQQLGLKLDARKTPIDILVIDQALKNPTDN